MLSELYHPNSPPLRHVSCESNANSAPDCIADLSFAWCAAAKETLANKKAKVTTMVITDTSLSMSPASAKLAEAIFAAESLLKSVGILSAYNYKQERELVTMIAKHLASRLGDPQVASFTFPIISMRGLVETLGQPSQETGEGYIWKLETAAAIRASLSRTLSKFSKELKVHGLSKPLQNPSENYVRMIATLLPTLEIHVESDGFSMDRLWVNMMNIIIDEAGEIHPPKNLDRREFVTDKALADEMMATAHADLRAMHAAGVNLSPNFLRQIGEEEAARELERAATATQVKQVMEQTHLIEDILEERKSSGKARSWFKVRWQGYHPSWEAWRIEGEPGTPLVTCEPMCNVMGTEALKKWGEQPPPP